MVTHADFELPRAPQISTIALPELEDGEDFSYSEKNLFFQKLVCWIFVGHWDVSLTEYLLVHTLNLCNRNRKGPSISPHWLALDRSNTTPTHSLHGSHLGGRSRALPIREGRHRYCSALVFHGGSLRSVRSCCCGSPLFVQFAS